jgi:predicted ATP-grasp superfamily ATP-dependent carboligase
LPDPEQAPDEWSAGVARLAASLGETLVLPVGEVATATLLDATLPSGCVLAAPPRDAYALAVDKHALLEAAARVGIATPRGALAEDPSTLSALPSGLEYPVVLKPRRSRWRSGSGWAEGGYPARVDTSGELAEAIRLPGMAGGVLVQEFVPGHGEGVFLLVDHGVVRARFAHRRLREKPPAGGISVVSESRDADPAELAGCERLVGELGWHGLAMLEFRRTPDGRAVLMELNPRLWGSLQLAIDAGVDFPCLLVDLVRGAPIQAPEARPGVRSRWLFGDLDHAWIALRRPAERRALGRGVWAVLVAFFASFFDGTRLEVWRRDDPRPFWRELRGRLG